MPGHGSVRELCLDLEEVREMSLVLSVGELSLELREAGGLGLEAGTAGELQACI